MKLPLTSERVPAHTKGEVNEKIRKKTEENIRFFGSRGRSAIDQRLKELEREWDTERCLETGASTLALAGAILGATVNRKFFLLPLAVGGFLLQHAIQGWCPPLEVLRRFGVRTMREIDHERFALKAARGDFEAIANNIKSGTFKTSRLMDAVTQS